MTTKRFTGQYHEEALGLYFYGARWYDPLLGRFTQADTLVPYPANPQAFNRYAYTLNNPLRFTDPSGHRYIDAPDDIDNSDDSGGGHHGGGGRHGRGGRGFPWWKYVRDLPSIYDIRAGGAYNNGMIFYGERWISVYKPPRVKIYRTQHEYFPIYSPCDSGFCLDAPYTVSDYWFGEDYGNVTMHPNARQNPIKRGTWTNLDVKQQGGQINPQEFLAGFVLGQSFAPDSLPTEPNEFGTPAGRISAGIDALGLVGYGGYGVTQMTHTDTFILQRNSMGDLRIIIMTTYQNSPMNSFYVSADPEGFIQFTPVHIPMIYSVQGLR